jgi:hypothetical protein
MQELHGAHGRGLTVALEQYTPHLAARGLDVTGLADRVHLAADVREAVRDADDVQENGPEHVEFSATAGCRRWPRWTR